MTDADEYRPFVVERPGKNGRIKLGPEARYWAEQHGMTLTEFARYLLLRDESGESAPESPSTADFLPNATPE
jgi:hypothetical protein